MGEAESGTSGTRRARVGLLVEVPPEAPPASVAAAAAAELEGFEAIWLRASPTGADATLVFAAALAGATEHVRIGVATAPGATLHPLRLAEDLAMVDIACRGRLDWIPGLAHAGETSLIAESLHVVLEAWQGEPFAHSGERWSFPELLCVPTPEQRPHPRLWLAADDPAPRAADTSVTGRWVAGRPALERARGEARLAVVCGLGERADDVGSEIALSEDAECRQLEVAELLEACADGILMVEMGVASAEGDRVQERRRRLVEQILSS